MDDLRSAGSPDRVHARRSLGRGGRTSICLDAGSGAGRPNHVRRLNAERAGSTLQSKRGLDTEVVSQDRQAPRQVGSRRSCSASASEGRMYAPVMLFGRSVTESLQSEFVSGPVACQGPPTGPGHRIRGCLSRWAPHGRSRRYGRVCGQPAGSADRYPTRGKRASGNVAPTLRPRGSVTTCGLPEYVVSASMKIVTCAIRASSVSFGLAV